VDLAVVSVQAAFLAQAGVFAIWDLADVRLAVFSFVLSEVCQCWRQVVWKSARQKTVTLSSTEAEYYALSNVAREAAWLYALLTELDYTGPDLRPLQVNGDNQGSLYLAENPQYHQKTKHIDVQYHYVRQEVRSNHINLHYEPTDQMPADGLTKPLAKEKHMRFLGLLVWNPSLNLS
jgi:hypothetical protein